MDFLNDHWLLISIILHNVITAAILSNTVDKTNKNITSTNVLLMAILFGWPLAAVVVYFTPDKEQEEI